MSFLHDRQARYFCVSLLAALLFLFIFDTALCAAQKNSVKKLFVSHDNAVASALLQHGVSEKTIADALTATQTSPQGNGLLNKLGITLQTDSRLLPWISNFEHKTKGLSMLKNLLFSFLLLTSAIIFLSAKERLYQHAIQTVTAYTNEDFSSHLPQQNNGSLYRLFSCIDNMAAALKSKQEREQETKVFLKNTISDVSHQLKTPLAALTMYNEIILDEPENTDTVKTFTQKAKASLDRIEKLIQSLLKITRLDAGGIEFNRNILPVVDLVSQAVEELTVRASHEKKEIILEGRHTDSILCDIHWTSQALGNIVKNALDHTGEGGQVRIKWENTPVAVRILISDNGTGIAPDDLHHIFKRFYRSRHSADTQGIGLGLPLAKAIIEGQSGTISVQSKPGSGTTFILSFLTEL